MTETNPPKPGTTSTGPQPWGLFPETLEPCKHQPARLAIKEVPSMLFSSSGARLVIALLWQRPCVH